MSVKMEIDFDLSRFGKKLNEMSDFSQNEAKKAIVAVALKIEGEAKKNIETGSRSGRTYDRGGGKTHTASAPGEYPKTDYGTLVSNITAEFAFDKLSATVGSRLGAPHGFDLEFGTSKTKARPWLGRTIEENRPYIQKRFDKAIAKIAEGFK